MHDCQRYEVVAPESPWSFQVPALEASVEPSVVNEPSIADNVGAPVPEGGVVTKLMPLVPGAGELIAGPGFAPSDTEPALS